MIFYIQVMISPTCPLRMVDVLSRLLHILGGKKCAASFDASRNGGILALRMKNCILLQFPPLAAASILPAPF